MTSVPDGTPSPDGRSRHAGRRCPLDGASQAVHLLLADLLVAHPWATQNIGLEKKLGLVDAIGGMAPEPFDVPDTLHPALRRGPVNAGIGFLTLRFWIVSFIFRFAGRCSARAAPRALPVAGDRGAARGRAHRTGPDARAPHRRRDRTRERGDRTVPGRESVVVQERRPVKGRAIPPAPGDRGAVETLAPGHVQPHRDHQIPA